MEDLDTYVQLYTQKYRTSLPVDKEFFREGESWGLLITGADRIPWDDVGPAGEGKFGWRSDK